MTVHPATQLPAAAASDPDHPAAAGGDAPQIVTRSKARRARVLRHATTTPPIDAIDEPSVTGSPDDF
jgi:hypothetical protein